MKRLAPLLAILSALLVSRPVAADDDDPPSAPVATQAPVAAQAPAAPIVKCECECRCGPSCACDPPEDDARDAAGMLFGVRVMTMNLHGSDHDGTQVGATFSGSADYFTKGGGSLARMFYAIGGSTAGFEGALGGSTLVGYRLDVGKHHGPVARAGVEGYLLGDELFYHSALEIPVLHLGWNYRRRDVALDGGLRGGPVVGGRYNPGEDASRRLSGSIEYGVYFAGRSEHARFDLVVHRVDARSTGTGGPVDIAQLQICGVMEPVGLCLDATGIAGDVDPRRGGPPYATRTFQGGLALAWTGWTGWRGRK